MAKQTTDPGFGIKVGAPTGRIINKDGSLNVIRNGERFHFSDVYHFVLMTSWTKFLLLTVAFYVVVNACFGTIYLLIGTSQIQNATSGTWWNELSDAMFFSSQTLTTVGYGNLAPGSALVSTVAAFEALTGLFIFGIFTGLSFGRFSRIKPRITFSKSAVVTKYSDTENALMCRIVNERVGMVMDAEASILLVMQEDSAHNSKRGYFTLPLELNHITSLALNWTLVHPITADSPLFGISTEDFVNRNSEILIIIKAFDDTVGESFYTRNSYRPHEVQWGVKFAPMFFTTAHGDVELHIDKIHDVLDSPLL
ncbi:MAG: potassium transporter [Ignavibacteria bacterium]|nr:potassium transporter [Ignavibacteria bacterium]